ncbi:Glycosyltransferase involved in cell wall bisynthesis [Marivirga sericea]|uniref:Glycosyltransferase involved in cell wall bisynthesis n=1 Tax=Marivirga sericea TaxID=1028 RepID=A0A1X7IAQ5_9BACT|nr:glycosyltransferase family 4 protein [Marivirga sericea]SMG11328.1 Glycosyltransferase involved in cell wall bisynthesis [Marivirga sericea]
MKTILATAYAVNPYKGSEDGMGWNMILQIAKKNKVIAITRENNQPHIDKYMEENPSDLYKNIRFAYFDLPYWMRFWKKGGRGAMLYYWMWQRGIVSFIRKQKFQYDIVHNLNFHNDWTPSYLWKLKKPFVWGPVGHHPRIPSKYLQFYDRKIKVVDAATWLVKKTFWRLSSSLRVTARKADHILCMNSSVAKVLPHITHKSTVLPSVATQDFGYQEKSTNGFNIISAGRLVALKGFDLTIKAFENFYHRLNQEEQAAVKLTLVGSGPEKERYCKMIANAGLTDKVEIIAWIDRKDLLNLYRESSVFLFPSHEGAGMVVAEAMSFGLPVVCLDNEGPGEFVDQSSGIAVNQSSSYNETIEELADGLLHLYRKPDFYQRLSQGARKRFENNFDWETRHTILDKVYKKVL